jgi:MerR family mercuric resistance operon transcriptional regulator
MATLTIGQVAKAAGIGVETVRYYERTGLVPVPPRAASGYRRYPPAAVERLGFIRHAQRLGFTLAEIAELLELHRDAVPCADVQRRAAAKVAAIEAKVAALLAVKADLVALVARCATECTSICTVLLAPAAGGGEEREPACPRGCRA